MLFFGHNVARSSAALAAVISLTLSATALPHAAYALSELKPGPGGETEQAQASEAPKSSQPARSKRVPMHSHARSAGEPPGRTT